MSFLSLRMRYQEEINCIVKPKLASFQLIEIKNLFTSLIKEMNRLIEGTAIQPDIMVELKGLTPLIISLLLRLVSF